ncbi:MAG TPA: hypothetical protein VFZ78_12755 [Flavisolibacter sp.]
MDQAYSLNPQGYSSSFTINYPWYGLFSSAEVKIVNEMERVYQCRLNNNVVLWIRKLISSGKWIDVNEERETTLTSVIGNYIDDYLRK